MKFLLLAFAIGSLGVWENGRFFNILLNSETPNLPVAKAIIKSFLMCILMCSVVCEISWLVCAVDEAQDHGGLVGGAHEHARAVEAEIVVDVRRAVAAEVEAF